MPVAVNTDRIRQSIQASPPSSNGTGGASTAAPSTSAPLASGGWLSEVLHPIRPLIARALPDQVNPERFIEAKLTELRSIDKVGDCPPAEICRGVMRLAQLGLEPGLAGHVNLYPTWSKARATTELVPRPTYKGVMELARRSGGVRTIRANPVYEGEDFDHFFDDSGEHLLHRPAIESTGQAIAYYAVAYGHDQCIVAAAVLSVAEVERRRSYSRRATSGAWVDHYEAMGRKTAILALGPFLPLTAGQVEVLEGDTLSSAPSIPMGGGPTAADDAGDPSPEPVHPADRPDPPNQPQAPAPTNTAADPETGELTTEPVPPARRGKGRRLPAPAEASADGRGGAP
jgi:recombination protein RecT